MNNNIRSFTELRQWLADLDDNEFVVCFLINSPTTQDEWMNPLAAYLNNNGFRTIGLFTANIIKKCKLTETQQTAVVDNNQIMELSRVNLFLTSDLGYTNECPSTSKVLGCVHAFESAHYTLLGNYIYSATRMDGLLLPFPLSEDNRKLCQKYWDCFATKDGCTRKSDNFYFIPVGYPRMQVLTDELAKSDVVPDSILYAPMLSTWSTELGGNRIKKYGKSIIRTMLEKFPDLNVIFRPYISDLNTQVVNSICSAFNNESRFILDDNPGRKYAFEHAKFLITDLSHIGKSFSYATLRPSVYYRPWLKGFSSKIETCGCFVGNLKELVRRGNFYCDHPDAHKESIIKAIKENVMPFSTSFADIATIIKDLYYDRPRDGWLTIRRFCDTGPRSELDLMRQMLPINMQSVVAIASTIAISRRPYSPLLIAYALHMGYIYFPRTGLLYGLASVLAQYLNLANVPHTYQELDPKIIRMLYAKALSGYVRQGASDGIEMVEFLLSSFEDTIKAKICKEPHQ